MKRIVVTGASRGLGLATARQLLEAGYAVTALNRTLSDALSALMQQYPHALDYLPLDLADLDAVADVGRRVIKSGDPVYGLVNNAAIGSDALLASTPRHNIETLIRTNLTGPILLTRLILPKMLARKEGRIVLITSINARTGFSGQTVYAATKAGLEGFARSLSREAGKRGVTVNCVAPGYMATALTSSMDDESQTRIARRSPLGPATPEDAAGAVLYLLSAAAARVTGTVLTVDGGSSA